jgi:dolichyl-phosphate beta-glucosyltransferase
MATVSDVGDAATRPLLSVVIPARNEATRLPAAVADICDFLSEHGSAELVVAADEQSRDETVSIADALARRTSGVRSVHVQRTGKCNALIAGVEAARGQLVLTADADLAVDPSQFPLLLREAGPRVVVVASRSVAGSLRIGEPLRRYLLGRTFNLAVRALVLPEFRDTQCGFKVFPRAAGLALLRRLQVHGWVFDVEFLALAFHEGFDVVEAPVTWRYGEASTVRPLRDAPRVAADFWKVSREFRRLERLRQDESAPRRGSRRIASPA